MNTLQDKITLITGASSGIGRATALRLAHLGAPVALVAGYRDALDQVRQEIEKVGGRALVVPTDVTEAAQVRHAVEATVAHFGQLDILICSAGLSMRAYFEGSQLDALERVMR